MKQDCVDVAVNSPVTNVSRDISLVGAAMLVSVRVGVSPRFVHLVAQSHQKCIILFYIVLFVCVCVCVREIEM